MTDDERIDGFVTYLAGVYGEHVLEKYRGALRAGVREDLRPFVAHLGAAARLIRRELDALPPYASLTAKVLPFCARAREQAEPFVRGELRTDPGAPLLEEHPPTEEQKAEWRKLRDQLRDQLGIPRGYRG